MQKISIYSFVIPKKIAKHLIENGVKKVEVVVGVT